MDDRRSRTRQRIVEAAAALLAESGRDAVSTRAVSSAAGVQAPTIYRLFGDKQGLLDAVSDHGFTAYLRVKTEREPTGDPVEDLRQGWDIHVEFGVRNPAFYALMYGEPRFGAQLPGARESARLLRDLVQALAREGRLRVEAETAARMIHAACSGVTLSLIAAGAGEGDPALSRLTREAVLRAITTGPEPPDTGGFGPAARAVAMKAVLPEVGPDLTPAEHGLLAEWLDRIARAEATGPGRGAGRR
ncbi:TetR/AcrR family transcriptional regulator [Nocardiopsis sediminis]|uniref:TetR/AcrR family transcriptional regulator n=1 Tax=Nocardiopsis sediminis TaxID=1778267 RepID=A0ABV8FHR7_9ACTN